MNCIDVACSRAERIGLAAWRSFQRSCSASGVSATSTYFAPDWRNAFASCSAAAVAESLLYDSTSARRIAAAPVIRSLNFSSALSLLAAYDRNVLSRSSQALAPASRAFVAAVVASSIVAKDPRTLLLAVGIGDRVN